MQTDFSTNGSGGTSIGKKQKQTKWNKTKQNQKTLTEVSVCAKINPKWIINLMQNKTIEVLGKKIGENAKDLELSIGLLTFETKSMIS